LSNYYTILVVPDQGKGFKSFRVPKTIFNSVILLLVVSIFFLGILVYDYFEILRQGQKNKYLTLENRQLKEQIEIFDQKLNSLLTDIDRIQVFEKKLKVITGIEDKSLLKEPEDKPPQISDPGNGVKEKNSYQEPDFQKLVQLHEEKIAQGMGLQTGYILTKEFTALSGNIFQMAPKYAQVESKMGKMKSRLSQLETDINYLDQNLLDKESMLKSTPTIMPTQGWVTSYFGTRKSEFSGQNKMHEGIDIGAPAGSKIISPADGIVTFAGSKPGFGYIVQVEHGYGLETVFAHASKLEVRKGEKVLRGDLLARIGSTGLSTGPHVHYEVRVNGTPVDPMHYILD
jgi:murein DD-endopeptidase MepM/ murein hydrolase activator NlpD